jgi:hypothetical protein
MRKNSISVFLLWLIVFSFSILPALAQYYPGPSGGGGSTSPGGSPNQIQYNNAGSFGGLGLGTAGQVMTSNGPSAAPSMQNPGASSLLTTRIATTTPVNVLSTDTVVVVKLATPGPAVVNLPASPSTGQHFYIKDGSGNAETNNITITPASGTIDGAGTFIIDTNYADQHVHYNGTEWGNL